MPLDEDRRPGRAAAPAPRASTCLATVCTPATRAICAMPATRIRAARLRASSRVSWRSILTSRTPGRLSSSAVCSSSVQLSIDQAGTEAFDAAGSAAAGSCGPCARTTDPPRRRAAPAGCPPCNTQLDEAQEVRIGERAGRQVHRELRRLVREHLAAPGSQTISAPATRRSRTVPRPRCIGVAQQRHGRRVAGRCGASRRNTS